MDKREEIAGEEHPVYKMRRTLGQKTADALTSIAGSWIFITILLILIFSWITFNVTAYIEHWDPYPFVFLNLILGSLATILAPIILISQNREEQKSKLLAKYDYNVNRKAEKEIREIKEQLARIERKLK
jgi:uncharacterized membrane protein